MRIVYVGSNVDCHSIKAAIEIYTIISSPSSPSFPGLLCPCRKERLCTAGLGWCLFDMLLSSLFCHFHCAIILGRVNPRAGLSFLLQKLAIPYSNPFCPPRALARESFAFVCLFSEHFLSSLYGLLETLICTYLRGGRYCRTDCCIGCINPIYNVHTVLLEFGKCFCICKVLVSMINLWGR